MHLVEIVLLLLTTPVVVFASEDDSSANKVKLLNGLPYIQAQHGLYIGKALESRKGPYYAFMGIRYAVTPKRYEKSIPVSELDVLPLPMLTQNLGTPCPQISIEDLSQIGKEDCLFANIFVPNHEPEDADGFPVIVFIHPGSFISGSGGEFDVKYFMDENVVFATFNYRLGALGFLSTEDDVLSGNLGLKDQITFLEWIRDNIADFGGNKRRVTVAGIEAGAASIQYLLLSQAASGLFQGAVMHGGSIIPTLLTNPLKFSKKMSDELECPLQPSHLLAECLRTKRLKEIMRAQKTISEKYFNFSSPFLPSVEKCRKFEICSDSFFTDSPHELLSQRRYKRVPLLLGMNSYTSQNIITENIILNLQPKSATGKDSSFISWLNSVLERIPGLEYKDCSNSFREIQQLYFNESMRDNGGLMNHNSLNSFLHEVFIVYGLWKFAMTYANDKPVYPYLITFQGMQSIFHGKNFRRVFQDGIEFLTPSLPVPHEFMDDSDEATFSQHLVHLWTSFATHHKPVDVWHDKQTWLPLSSAQLNGEKPITWYALDRNVQQIPEPFTHRMKFWNKLFTGLVGVS